MQRIARQFQTGDGGDLLIYILELSGWDKSPEGDYETGAYSVGKRLMTDLERWAPGVIAWYSDQKASAFKAALRNRRKALEKSIREEV
jgi:hypothetical protein